MNRGSAINKGGPALVTGGSSGIGLAIARRLAGMGIDVALIARDRGRLADAAAELRADFPTIDISAHSADVRDYEALSAIVRDVETRLGPPSWLVTSAGIAEPGLFLEQSRERHHEQMDVNYLGTLNAIHSVVPAMAAAGRGRLILVSSGAGLFGIYGYAAYAPSKFAVRGLAEVLRVELAGRGIGVTIVYPPDTDTPQLTAEAAFRPAVTTAIAAGGGVWSADAVARVTIDAAVAGRFLVAPGVSLTLLASLHSLIAPVLRLYQRMIIRAVARKRQA